MESETTLVWAESGVVLHTVSLVDLAHVVVVFPDNSELDDTLGDGDDLKSLPVFGVLLEESGLLEGGDELYECVSSGQILLQLISLSIGVAIPYRCGPAQTLAQTLRMKGIYVEVKCEEVARDSNRIWIVIAKLEEG